MDRIFRRAATMAMILSETQPLGAAGSGHSTACPSLGPCPDMDYDEIAYLAGTPFTFP